MYDDVLLPTDGSDAADAAVPHAIELADRYGARLHVLYVADTTEYSTVTFENEVVDPLEQEGRGVVDEVVETASAHNVETVGSVLKGGAYKTILQYVDDEGIDVVVMGTHGRRGLDRALLGSVTERIVRTSDVPVLTVREDDQE